MVNERCSEVKTDEKYQNKIERRPFLTFKGKLNYA